MKKVELEKQASSEIAERLKKYKAEIFGGKLISIGGIGWQHGDLIQLLELAERDTRERCAQIVENEPLGYITESEHGKLENFADRVVERIRGKE